MRIRTLSVTLSLQKMAAVQPPDAALQAEEEIEQFPSHSHSNQADSNMAPGEFQALLFISCRYRHFTLTECFSATPRTFGIHF